jgi:hypothetical protein
MDGVVLRPIGDYYFSDLSFPLLFGAMWRPRLWDCGNRVFSLSFNKSGAAGRGPEYHKIVARFYFRRSK